MSRVLLLLIRLVTPRAEREWIVGDTLEELEHQQRTAGPQAARRWLLREAWLVLRSAPRYHWTLRTRVAAGQIERTGDGLIRTVSDDARYAVRLLTRSPGFAAIAIATLALGIGANTAMFAVVNGVLLKPLPFDEPDRLMLLHLLAPDRQRGPGVFREVSWSYPKYQSFLKTQTAFESAAAFAGREMSLTDVDEPERLRGEVATERYLSVLGITPLMGRSFTRDEAHIPGTAPVAMIGEALWRRRFGSDSAIIGRTIHVDRNPHTVVAVLPRGFRGLTGQADIWIPLATYQPAWLTQAQNHSFTLVARRNRSTTEEEAAAVTTHIGTQLEAEYPNGGFGVSSAWSAKAVSLSASRTESDLRRTTLVLLGAVGFTLLIACVNLTTLVSTKALGRSREVAIRIALGATRRRIARQFVVETLVITVTGALLGLLLATAMLSASASLLPDSETFFRARDSARPQMRGSAGLTQIGAAMIGIDSTTVLFAGAVALLSAWLIAALPAIQSSLLRPIEALKAAAAAGIGTRRRFDVRPPLVVTQIALSVVLLAGAGLMLKSLARLHGTSIGIDSARMTTARIQLPPGAYSPDASRQLYRSFIERVRAIPGVEAAALGSCVPVSGGCNSTLIRFERGLKPFAGNEPGVGVYWASPTYFSTMGIRVVRGRTFIDNDRVGSPKVVVVNETAARTFWPGKDPIGTFVAVGQGDFNDGAEVVGIVSDVRYGSIETAPVPDVYVPILQSFQPRAELFVRSGLQTGALVPALRSQLRALDPNLPLANLRLMNERLDDATWQTRASAWLLSAFAGLAMLLTTLGLFGVMTQTVAHRTPEFGIRLAIGAEAGDVLRLVLRRALTISGAGLLLGVAAAFILSRALAALLYDVPTHDPSTYLAVAAGMALVLLIAAYVPARRALHIDAIAALRSE